MKAESLVHCYSGNRIMVKLSVNSDHWMIVNLEDLDTQNQLTDEEMLKRLHIFGPLTISYYEYANGIFCVLNECSSDARKLMLLDGKGGVIRSRLAPRDTKLRLDVQIIAANNKWIVALMRNRKPSVTVCRS